MPPQEIPTCRVLPTCLAEGIGRFSSESCREISFDLATHEARWMRVAMPPLLESLLVDPHSADTSSQSGVSALSQMTKKRPSEIRWDRVSCVSFAELEHVFHFC